MTVAVLKTAPDSRMTHITETIINHLSASEISFLRYILKIKSDFIYSDRYLNPLKDINSSIDTFQGLIKKGYTILLIDPDTKKLVERIKSPYTY